MVEIKNKEGYVLFSFDESKTTLAKEIEKYKNLAFADLGGANLITANLQGADIRGANLQGADLKYTNLQDADFRGANLVGARLWGADLAWANLVGANLEGADLFGANLEGANLEGANLKDANIEYADLLGASGVPEFPLACPAEGSFIAWKKVDDDYLVKLEIPADARRSSATTKKCRCDKALVLDIKDLTTGEHLKRVVNKDYCECLYEVDKMVYPDSFDEDRWRECSHGIHFFMDRQDAIDY